MMFLVILSRIRLRFGLLAVQQGALTVPTAYAASKKGSGSRATLTTAKADSRRVVRVTTSYAPLTLQTDPLTPQL